MHQLDRHVFLPETTLKVNNRSNISGQTFARRQNKKKQQRIIVKPYKILRYAQDINTNIEDDHTLN